ncbi:hypothetical protein NDU88_003259 [Pleurodeles waltl]|uniref:Uncharacterized protein n=1 Tax=Pleurodeles waltl TaxID=8319 RepID=A0AAV7KXN8_PLEWA|nr:hypothetical protein NDU88_003259 [Pleurodeles waltl]
MRTALRKTQRRKERRGGTESNKDREEQAGSAQKVEKKVKPKTAGERSKKKKTGELEEGIGETRNQRRKERDREEDEGRAEQDEKKMRGELLHDKKQPARAERRKKTRSEKSGSK